MAHSPYLDLLWLIPVFPFLGALLNAVLGKKMTEGQSGGLAVLAVLASFVFAVLAIVDLGKLPPDIRTVAFTDNVFQWIYIGRFQIDFSLTLDQLSAVMTLVITGVGALIHLYAIGYMHGDPRFTRFFTYLNLFVGSMLLLVLGSNYVLLYVGWELVGLCSYLLIGFWFDRPSAAQAGTKAFLVNRVGDFGFAIGIFLIFLAMVQHIPNGVPIGLGFNEVSSALTRGLLPTATATIICWLLFWGATAKSAQIPLYVWLPDAMEGPTPVSALIHAATMVTAGVYMVARNHVLFSVGNPSVGGVPIVALIGALTAIFAAIIAIAQYDIKKVLAYSTISQLGYMFIGVGIGAYSAGIFHLITHAFFKACLFLGAGSVMHGLHNEVDMRRMGGLRRYMPITAITFGLATLAISGLPPFAGFFSKDLILAKAYEYPHGGMILYALGWLTASLTAFYMFRLYLRIFEGNPAHPYEAASKGPQREADHSPSASHGLPHESPTLMTGVLAILAFLSVVGGFLSLPKFLGPDFLGTWLAPVFAGGEAATEAAGGSEMMLMGLAVVALVLGGLAALALYGPKKSPEYASAQGLERNPVLQNKFYVDELYSALFVKTGLKLAAILSAVDRYVVDGLVLFVGIMVNVFGEIFRFFQSGYIRWYAWSLLGGATVLLAWFALWNK